MKRREFMAATAATAIGLMSESSASAKEDKRPNILFIMTDQQSAKMLSCTGNTWLKTPALDRLAASGIRFERAYACNPVCVPNRFSLQTGLMPSAIGMRHNGDSASAEVTETMREQSLGRLFSKAGYETVFGGKVHLPRKMKSIESLGYRNLTNDRRLGLAEACAEFIKGRHTKPFFLFASFINPHDICYMAINDYNRTQGEAPMANTDSKICEAVLDNVRSTGDVSAFVEGNCPSLPANHEVPEAEPECIMAKYIEPRPFQAYTRRKWSAEQWRLHRWAYCRLTEMVDAKIGIVLKALREAGLEKNTLVVFTSDHGDMDSSHRLEHKQVLYEESVRIPFIMSYKGIIPKGKVDDTHLISNGLDLLPTLCDYAGIEIPKGRPGQSVRSLAEGKPVKSWRDFVAVESHYGRMVRTARFKYCIHDSGRHAEQLIDLKTDPGEMKNLAEAETYKDVLKTHRRLLCQWVEEINDNIGAEYVKS